MQGSGPRVAGWEPSPALGCSLPHPHPTSRELFLAQVTPELLCEQSLSETREARFKFPKVTLDGVRRSQEEVRPERKSSGQASHSPGAKLRMCFFCHAGMI